MKDNIKIHKTYKNKVNLIKIFVYTFLYLTGQTAREDTTGLTYSQRAVEGGEN